MKRYWHFIIVAIICLVVALAWAQPGAKTAPGSVAVDSSTAGASTSSPAKHPPAKAAAKNNGDTPLPDSSSSLPLLAVIGFGVLAGGITSAMRTR